MTVPKSKRHKSRFEVFHNMQALQKELVKHLMQDFGITRIADLGEAQFLDLKFERVINLCAEIVGIYIEPTQCMFQICWNMKKDGSIKTRR